jgi:hypothetical protein
MIGVKKNMAIIDYLDYSVAKMYHLLQSNILQ